MKPIAPPQIVRKGVHLRALYVRRSQDSLYLIVQGESGTHPVFVSTKEPPRCSCQYYHYQRRACSHIIAGLKYLLLLEGWDAFLQAVERIAEWQRRGSALSS